MDIKLVIMKVTDGIPLDTFSDSIGEVIKKLQELAETYGKEAFINFDPDYDHNRMEISYMSTETVSERIAREKKIEEHQKEAEKRKEKDLTRKSNVL